MMREQYRKSRSDRWWENWRRRRRRSFLFRFSEFNVLFVVTKSRAIFIQRRKTLELAKISKLVIFTKQDGRCRQLPKITMDKFKQHADRRRWKGEESTTRGRPKTPPLRKENKRKKKMGRKKKKEKDTPLLRRARNSSCFYFSFTFFPSWWRPSRIRLRRIYRKRLGR